MKPIRTVFSEKLLFISLFLVYSNLSYGQYNSSSKSNNVLNNWAFEGQVGVFSYFGDLSIYDGDIVNKMSNESGPAFGLSVTKYFGKSFAASGEMIFGQVKAEKNNTSFSSNIIEYNAQVQFDLMKIFFYERKSNFGLILSGGIGNILFSSTKKSDSITEEYSTRVPEFLYFFGGKLEYHPSKVIKLGIGISIKQLQNDKLDLTSLNSNFDYYSYVNFGVAYKLNHKAKRRGGRKLNTINKRKKSKR